MFLIFLSLILSSYALLTNGKCTECLIPTLVYEDLNCTPKYSDSNQCCPLEYDCSNIYNRPKDTCHLRGKFYQPGDIPNKEDVAGFCEHALCECGQKGIFKCIVASDSCAEFWVPNFIKPGCYLTHEQNRCCHVDQKCPPFDEDAAKCEVEDKLYKEGEKFEHPSKKCTKCICNKGFTGKLDNSFCQRHNCTTELLWSESINNYCAPAYLRWEDCCPRKWICPLETGTYALPSTLPPADSPKCKFGDKTMVLGEKYTHERQTCECIIPPYLTCKY
ncbi:hypothetical protein RN001_000581 [Aquatica leii]|uniref:VWFC domain-containing protein n=1 Tax=Aquatica leii TaxID=1421715 RepID=A0AAN7SSH0_9COLE|nr:hypothetical protein RN001_000581 [Aquatica leii]